MADQVDCCESYDPGQAGPGSQTVNAPCDVLKPPPPTPAPTLMFKATLIDCLQQNGNCTPTWQTPLYPVADGKWSTQGGPDSEILPPPEFPSVELVWDPRCLWGAGGYGFRFGNDPKVFCATGRRCSPLKIVLLKYMVGPCVYEIEVTLA